MRHGRDRPFQGRQDPTTGGWRAVAVSVAFALSWVTTVAVAAAAPQETLTESAPIRRALEELADSTASPPPSSGPPATFRTSVTAFTPLPPAWVESKDLAARLPPLPRGSRLYHQEFLARVTPEAFRRSTLGPIGQVSTDPGTVLHGIRTAWREHQAKRIRERIDQELAALR